MTKNNPIIPSPELVRQWMSAAARAHEGDKTWIDLATQAACWGADQELEACCEYLRNNTSSEVHYVINVIRAARRPKPPSLVEEAMKALKRQSARSVPSLVATEDCDTIRAALERLQQLEQENQSND